MKKILYVFVPVVLALLYAGVVAVALDRHAGAPQGTLFQTTPSGVVGAAPAIAGEAFAGTSIAYPYPGPGPFQPGMPPFGQAGVGGDGVSAWGVAFKEVSDQSAQPDTDLVKSAYQDAQKKAQMLAAAAGLKLGSVIALSDYSLNQPHFGGCVQPYAEKGAPAPALRGAPAGSGNAVPQIAPAPPGPLPPVPACQAKHYLVVWVLARYAIA